jgi:pimeloyl-ACP methyl ester carboxylesterase/DNA-binding CsgD family transcriptional regulator
MQDMTRANVALVIETLYQIAADPEGWEQLVDVLALTPEEDEPPAEIAPDLARMADIAKLVTRPTDTALTRRSDVGWVVISQKRRVIACNGSAQAVMATGLGRLAAGEALTFDDPGNNEVLDRAIEQTPARGAGAQTILKFERLEDEEGPCFAYLIPASALPTAVGGTLALMDDGAYALVFPAAEATSQLWTTLRESFGLTAAEARLARKLRDGRSLQDAAEDMGVSVNTLRNQLRGIFDKMGLKRQSDLVRALTELSSIAGAIEFDGAPAPEIDLSGTPPISRITLSDGRVLAYRDYGDRAGAALLCFHEGVGSSLLPAGTDAMAARLGLRVLCADRPGFGQSDPRSDYSFNGVADDMVELCDHLGLAKVRLAAILSGAPSAIQTAIQLGPRAERLLLVSGRPPRPYDRKGRQHNTMTLFRERIQNTPWVIETFYAIVRLQLSPELVGRVIRRTASFSKGDAQFIEDHPDTANYIAGYVGECLAIGSRGTADEVRAFRRAQNFTASDLTTPLIVWHGAEDVLAPSQDLMDFLGDKAQEVWIAPGIGHFMGLKYWPALLKRMAQV